jgi:hypothetical protein
MTSAATCAFISLEYILRIGSAELYDNSLPFEKMSKHFLMQLYQFSFPSLAYEDCNQSTSWLPVFDYSNTSVQWDLIVILVCISPTAKGTLLQCLLSLLRAFCYQCIYQHSDPSNGNKYILS